MAAFGVARRAFGVYPVVVSTPLPWAMLAASRPTPPMRTGLKGGKNGGRIRYLVCFILFHRISENILERYMHYWMYDDI